MVKNVNNIITYRMILPAGKATPAPPVGSALGQRGLNIMEFCKKFNDECAKNKEFMGDPTPVDIIYLKKEKKLVSIKTHMPTASALIKRFSSIKKGSSTAGKEVVGEIQSSDVMKIAELKRGDTYAFDKEKMFKMISGTARSMGINVVDN